MSIAAVYISLLSCSLGQRASTWHLRSSFLFGLNTSSKDIQRFHRDSVGLELTASLFQGAEIVHILSSRVSNTVLSLSQLHIGRCHEAGDFFLDCLIG